MNIPTRPIYFRSAGETLFGWLHAPPENLRSDVGVVICKPFGYEAMCAHRSIRAFADGGASAGATVLRFDYAGTGDASGGDTDADQIGQWCGDIRAAVDTLRQVGGVKRIVLLGVRLGAMLAALVADADPSVDALIAVAPVISGRRYLRELRAYQATSSSAIPGTPAIEPGGAMEVTGFSLSAAAVERLAKTDLLRLEGRAVRDALILDRLDLPSAKPWADALRGLDVAVQYRALPGFLEMVSTPHAAQIPCRWCQPRLNTCKCIATAHRQTGTPPRWRPARRACT